MCPKGEPVCHFNFEQIEQAVIGPALHVPILGYSEGQSFVSFQLFRHRWQAQIPSHW
jgi:hypothetical protein